MKYLSKKVINGRDYYYLQYRTYSKIIGITPPKDYLREYSVFFAWVARHEYAKLSQKIKDEFKFGDLEKLEKGHYYHLFLKKEHFSGIYSELLSKFIILFTYHSNRQEGSRVTKKEVESVALSNIRKPKTRTEHEVMDSLEAFRFAVSDEMNWNMKHIKHIHYLLLKELDPLIAGQWKTENNVAPGNQMTVDYKDVPKKIKEFLAWYQAELKKKTLYPPRLALQFYVEFEAIHPFLDGNGRVGRILLNAILHKFDYPFVIFFSENAKQHTDAIRQAREGRWSKFYKHFLDQSKKTANILDLDLKTFIKRF